MKIVIDKNKCIGDGTCIAIASNTFQFDADNKAEVKEGSLDEQNLIMQAAEACPVQAITVFDDKGKQIYHV